MVVAFIFHLLEQPDSSNGGICGTAANKIGFCSRFGEIDSKILACCPENKRPNPLLSLYQIDQMKSKSNLLMRPPSGPLLEGSLLTTPLLTRLNESNKYLHRQKLSLYKCVVTKNLLFGG